MFLVLLFSILLFQFVNSNYLKTFDNSSIDEYDLSGLMVRTREKRLVSFNKFEKNEVKVAIEMRVPFLNIPTKRSSDKDKQALVNINLSTIIFGMVVAAIGAGAGAFSRLLVGDSSPTSSFFEFNRHKASRKEDSPSDYSIFKILESIDDDFLNHNIDLVSCTQMILCGAVKNSVLNILDGKETKLDKILNGLVSSKWLMEYTTDTLFEKPIKSGRKAKNCEETFHECKIHTNAYSFVVSNYLNKNK